MSADIFSGVNILAIWFICPESHIWMFLHDKENEAFKSLERLRGNTQVATLEMKLIKENNQKATAFKSLEKHNDNPLFRARWENHSNNPSIIQIEYLVFDPRFIRLNKHFQIIVERWNISWTFPWLSDAQSAWTRLVRFFYDGLISCYHCGSSRDTFEPI